jgi:glycerol-3-phosphate dehydrogenase (NAD(P)+)
VLGKVAVVGAGSWGTTVAAMVAGRVPTVLWARRRAVAEAVEGRRENPEYLPGVRLPASLAATDDLVAAVRGAALVVMAVPSHGLRAVAEEVGTAIGAGVPVLSLSKGLEQGTHLRMTEVLGAVLPGHPSGVLTGPNLAAEIAAGQPAATVVAMVDEALAGEIQALLMTETFRVYTNPDVVGCEVSGATKNVLAIAAGIVDGLGLGDSTLAALITRGLAELGRLVVAMGGQRMTVAGLAGVGDLVATCTSHHSRNRHVGALLGRGWPLERILADMQMVAEGVKTARSLVEMAAVHGVEMPIGEQVALVLEGASTPGEAISALMQRSATSEFGRTGPLPLSAPRLP